MNFFILFLATFINWHFTNAAALTDQLSSLFPNTCSDTCKSWINNIGSCVENLGQKVGFSLDPISGVADLIGDKFGIYLCTCNDSTIEESSGCLDCISKRYCLQDPLSTDSYRQICNGSDPYVVIKTKFGNVTC